MMSGLSGSVTHAHDASAVAHLLADGTRSSTAAHRSVLLALACIGHPATLDHIAAVCGQAQTTCSRHLNDWRRLGYVERHTATGRHPDSRWPSTLDAGAAPRTRYLWGLASSALQ